MQTRPKPLPGEGHFEFLDRLAAYLETFSSRGALIQSNGIRMGGGRRDDVATVPEDDEEQ